MRKFWEFLEYLLNEWIAPLVVIAFVIWFIIQISNVRC